jgi:glycine/D-amino acid oxidase-like deaminating enzyme
VLVIDERPPMTLTSDKSTECYRNWWPGPGDTMVRFMNHSIDLLEEMAGESGNFFGLNRRGYVFLTADPARVDSFIEAAKTISALGAGPIRYHELGQSTYQPSSPEGYESQLTGADLLFGSELIRQYYPFVTEDVIAMLNPRRCGWLSAQQLGMYMFDQAKANGARFLSGKVTDISVQGGRIQGVEVDSESGAATVHTGTFINAAGPFVKEIGKMIGVDLPVFNELHGKISFNDPLGVVPREVPLMIWSDPVSLPWSEDERQDLAAYEDTQWLLEEFPAGVHFRPEGLGHSPILLILWTYDVQEQKVVLPPKFDDFYPEIVVRGLTRMVPGLSAYINKMGRPVVDGGYYCKTQENRPLIGPLSVEGAYILGAVSGYGVMAGPAAGELLAAHVLDADLPDYAPQFRLDRYDDPEYQNMLASWDATSGQL